MSFDGTLRELVDAFVRTQEETKARVVAELGIDEQERWTNYKLLQVFDFISLYFCRKDLERGEPTVIEPTPVNYAGDEVALSVEPAGPWRVRIDPYPFAESPAEFTVLRRLVPKRRFADGESFARELLALEPELVRIATEPG